MIIDYNQSSRTSMSQRVVCVPRMSVTYNSLAARGHYLARPIATCITKYAFRCWSTHFHRYQIWYQSLYLNYIIKNTIKPDPFL